MSSSSSRQATAESHLATLFGESGLVILGRLLGLPLGFGVNYLLAQYFGETVLGRYSLVQTVLGIAVIFTVAGLNQGLVKYVSRQDSGDETDTLQKLVSSALVFATMLALAGAAMLFAGRSLLANDVFDDPSLGPLFVWGAIILVPFTLTRLLNGLYRGVRSYGLYSIANQVGLRLILVVSLIVALLSSWTTATAPLVGYLLGVTAVAAGGIRYAKSYGVGLPRRPWRYLVPEDDDLREMRNELVAFSSTMVFVTAMGFVSRKIDVLMAGIYLSSSEVGVYKIAVTVAEVAAVFLIAANAIFSSIISSLFSEDRTALLEALYISMTKWLVVFSLPLVLSMWTAPRIILAFFGEAYVEGAAALQLLAGAYLANVAVGSAGYMLTMTDHEKLQLVNTLALAALNIGLNALLIPLYGITGAALATGISIATINLVRLAEVRLLLEFSPYGRPSLSLVVTVTAMIAITWGLAPFLDQLVHVVLLTLLNLAVGVGITFLFRTELDRRLLGRFWDW